MVELIEGAADTLRQWLKDSEEKGQGFVLNTSVDQGATNARVALGKRDGSFIIVAKFQTTCTKMLIDNFKVLSDLLFEFLPAGCVRAGCMGAAGRILDDGKVAEITNYTGDRMVSISDLPHTLFPPGHSKFINDLESTCFGLIGLDKVNELEKYFKLFLPYNQTSGVPSSLPLQRYLVCAVGTGLGMALVHVVNGQFYVLPCEGGHCYVSGMATGRDLTATESDLEEYLSLKLYDSKHPIEYEDIVSGRGLSHVYSWLHRDTLDKGKKWLAPESPAKISSLAIAAGHPDDSASQALRIHYRYLAKASQNLAVALQAKGIFWAGDNQINNGVFVDGIHEELHSAFLDHPKREWLEDVNIYCQHAPLNINLVGTLYVANDVL